MYVYVIWHACGLPVKHNEAKGQTKHRFHPFTTQCPNQMEALVTFPTPKNHFRVPWRQRIPPNGILTWEMTIITTQRRTRNICRLFDVVQVDSSEEVPIGLKCRDKNKARVWRKLCLHSSHFAFGLTTDSTCISWRQRTFLLKHDVGITSKGRQLMLLSHWNVLFYFLFFLKCGSTTLQLG